MILSVVQCDLCGNQIAYRHYGKTHIIKWVREKGWSVGKTIKCPKCKTKVNK